jgi:hypothetical protein
LLKDWRAQRPEALERVGRRHPKFKRADAAEIAAGKFALADAQLVIAREYGFSNWTELKERIAANTVTGLLLAAIEGGDAQTTVRLLRAHPNLLHIPLWSGNWGPPMSHAANLGGWKLSKRCRHWARAIISMRSIAHCCRGSWNARDGCTKWRALTPGIVMGACETLNPAGLGFLAELGAPFTDSKGDRLAPLALVLETYSEIRGKRAVLEIFARQGYTLPDTP